MKRLLIFAVFYLSFAVCDVARSQMQIDSVIIRYSDLLRTSHSYLTHSQLGKYNESFDTSVVSGVWSYITQSQSITGDSIILSPAPKSQQQGTLTVSYDTSAKKINECSQFFAQGNNYGGSSSSLYFKDVIIDNFDTSSHITLDSTMILSSKFRIHNYKSYPSNGGGQGVDEWDIQVPKHSAFVNISFFRSTPKSKVDRFISNTNGIFPNPASITVTVRHVNSVEPIKIFDQLGREVHIPEINRTDESVSFNTSSLIPGIHWLRVGSQTQKIIIQR